MSFGSLGPITDIPFLAKTNLQGRFIASLMFYDGVDWHTWLQTEQPDLFIKIRAWPAELFYFSKEPENQNDLYSAFFDFVGQIANISSVKRPFGAIQDDILNLSASLAKFPALHSTKSPGATRLAATEVEYVLFICRSLFDLLQEVIKDLWDSIKLRDTSVKKKQLKKSFADMALHADTLQTARQVADKFAIPMPLAECYARNAPMFLKIRKFRDDLVHRGHRVQTIFNGDDGFLITKDLGSFRDIAIWRDHEIITNGLAPLGPVLNLIIHGTIAACEDFAVTLATTFKWQEPTVPGMHLYMRGYHNEALSNALTDANSRVAEGRSLVSVLSPPPKDGTRPDAP